jgi:hypothetical protein
VPVINRRLVYAMREVGCGYGETRKLSYLQAEKQCTPEQKQRRKYLRGRKKMKEDKRTQQEGPTYAAGEF